MPQTRSFCFTRLALGIALLGAAGSAHAQAVHVGLLDGASVTPPTASTATGEAEVSADVYQLLVDLSFTGLIGTSIASHIHCCAAPPTNVAIAVPFPSFPTGFTSGVYANTFDLLEEATYQAGFLSASGGTAADAREALLAGVRAGQAYTCVHTTAFPGSEIRSHLAFDSFSDGFESGSFHDWIPLGVPF